MATTLTAEQLEALEREIARMDADWKLCPDGCGRKIDAWRHRCDFCEAAHQPRGTMGRTPGTMAHSRRRQYR